MSFRLRSRYGANRAGRVDGRARGGPGQGKKRSLGGEKAGVQNLFGGMPSGKTNITMENQHFYIMSKSTINGPCSIAMLV